MISTRTSAFAIAILVLLRAVMAAMLPLSADEAYYLMWSHHLAAGYYDHPPAIAFLIRCGTFLFGDTPLGVRAMGLPQSLLTTWFVWQTAILVLKDERKAALAALLFNLTLMANVELLAATPDQPSIVTVAAYLWCLCKVQQTGKGQWWLAAGLAAGLSLLAKFSMLFAGAGTLVWLLADARARVWLFKPWPYLGGVVALLVFSPNLVWQAQHQWLTFAFQFGRVGHGDITLRYLGEFLGAQLGLATPLILVLAGLGFWRARKPGNDRFMLVALVGTALVYFLVHALRDRVQGNWPCFLYPVLAILAADAMFAAPRWLMRTAAPLAAAILLAVYAQAAFQIVPLRNDPAARLLARDFPQVARAMAMRVEYGIADAVVTTDYQTTSLLHYYQPALKVIQLGEPWRYPDAPAPSFDLLNGKLLYLAEKRREQTQILERTFLDVRRISPPASAYQTFQVGNPQHWPEGKLP